ncbi:unnamed protein product [Musa acuminata subsp. malaccensis]|uniref:(wild Malaysian banana) hypothetical protein n=1 Tax=Musa acuminata subsp. malaccensis TaxID=214687 RepID=A0A804KE85_MUSAM|nr:unnamed protein product [Musa acuminata subsp. malaccensis]
MVHLMNGRFMTCLVIFMGCHESITRVSLWTIILCKNSCTYAMN